MTIQKTQAVLLNKKEIRETSCVASFYTKDFGKIKTLIKGVRGPRAVFGVLLQEFADYDIVYYERKRKQIYTLSECNIRQAFKQLNTDLKRRLWAYYAVELADKLTELEDKNADIYFLLLKAMNLFGSERFIDKAVMVFQIKFLHLLGFMPQLDLCANCGRNISENPHFSVRFGGALCAKCTGADAQSFAVSKGALASMRKLAKTALGNLSRIIISKDLRNEIAQLLERFINYQLGEHLRSAGFIKSIVNFKL